MFGLLELGVGFSVIYLSYLYYKSKSTPIKLYFVRTEENEATLKKCPTIFEEYKNTASPIALHSDGAISSQAKYIPPFWLLSVHLHTIWASTMVRKFLDLPFTREIITAEDNGTISVDFFDSLPGTCFSRNTPTIIILHGLTGGSYESYVQHLAYHAMKKSGMRAVVVNFRGCANTKVTSKRMYCAANTEDFRAGIEHIKKKFPTAPLFAAGFSLGSIILVKYLSEMGDKSPFIAAASLSNPMDLNTSSKNLKKSLFANYTYNRTLANNLKRLANQWVEFWQGSTDIDLAHVMASQSILDFDERLTAKVWGYNSVEDYYSDAGPINNIQKVQTKLLCVNCVDDPLTYVHGILPEFKKNPNIIMALLQWGGHLGFLEGWGHDGPSWSDRAVVEFFQYHLNKK